MYEFILSNYLFLADSIVKEKDFYLIKKNNDILYLYEIIDSSSVFMQYRYSLKYSFYDCFIFNRYHSLISYFQNHPYVLLKKRNQMISSYYPLFHTDFTISFFWYQEWIKRSDYLENTYSMIHGCYEVIDDSFDYYLGLLEMSVFYVRDYQNTMGNGFIQQKKYDIHSITNPLNIIIDFKERDFAEYLKFIFWNDLYQSINLSDIIYQNKDSYDFNLVLARVLYPNYYFNDFDQVVFFHEDSAILKKYIIRSLEFQEYVLNISYEMSRYFPIKKIPI